MYAFGISSKGSAERIYCSKHFIITNSVQILSKRSPPLKIHEYISHWEENQQTICSESCQNQIDLETGVVDKYQDFIHSQAKKNQNKTKLLRIWEQNLSLGILKQRKKTWTYAGCYRENLLLSTTIADVVALKLVCMPDNI